MYYVYRFLDGTGNVIYVGRTRNGIKTRMRQHFVEKGHLPIECYNSVHVIEYIQLSSQIDMYIKELYYIDKWKPKYNTLNKYEEDSNIVIDEDVIWLQYKDKKDVLIEELKGEVETLMVGIDQLKSELEIIRSHQVIFSKQTQENDNLVYKQKIADLERQLESKKMLSELNRDVSNKQGYTLDDCKTILNKFNTSLYAMIQIGGKNVASYVLYKNNSEIRVSIKNEISHEDYPLKEILGLKKDSNMIFHFNDSFNLELIGKNSGFNLIESKEYEDIAKYVFNCKMEAKRAEEEKTRIADKISKAESSLTKDEMEVYCTVYQELDRDEMKEFDVYYYKHCKAGDNILDVCQKFKDRLKSIKQAS